MCWSSAAATPAMTVWALPSATAARRCSSWPQWPRVCKTDYGQEEAAAVFGRDPRVYQATVKELVKDESGKVCKAILVSLAPQKDPESGRTAMVPVEGSEREVPADLVLIAAGFLGAQTYVADAFGDMHRGQSLVVWAIREGREVAREVDRWLMGYTNLA